MDKPFSYKFYRTTQAAWDAMYQEILVAQKSIYWEIYIFIDDEAGNRFIDALCDRARVGVDVKIIIDAFGSWGLSRPAETRLIEAGVEVLKYNRIHPEFAFGKWWRRLWRRNHRKLLIIDEAIAFVGGVNVESKALEWDDLFLKLTGPVIRPLLTSFAKTYRRAGGSKSRVRHLLRSRLPAELKTLPEKIKFIAHSPLDNRLPAVRKLYLRSIAMAKESINVLTPYFVPDLQLLRLITKAKRRGVKINLFLPARTDHLFMELIARAYYGLIHRTGANVYFLPKMNHGKAIMIDDKTGFVGSANVTPRSWYINDEAGVYFDDEKMADELKGFFEDWKAGATPLDLEKWKKRGWRAKLKEWWVKRIENYV
ncbi:MAG: phosphatidylserine/phosphatidylglycerophosphate/cardiolipin synthase family protein [Candidatus Magasanikbacteria bacterium]|nr:phosphatidylserine/phosphatidylglycerophosphate/cardiolipin synthase family protein [Candidatus Magasanikbacteria bacterium]